MGENFNRAVNRDDGISDGDDMRLFKPFLGAEVAKDIILAKHNFDRVKQICVVQNMSEGAWRRLGCILGKSTKVQYLYVHSNLDAAWLCEGLKYNTSIECISFFGVDLGTAMNDLAPFLSSNPCIKDVDLGRCSFGPAGVSILSNALSNRPKDTLRTLRLQNNNISDNNSVELVLPLIRASLLCIASIWDMEELGAMDALHLPNC